MKQRGRKSAAELAVAPVINVIPRPTAPDELSDEMAIEWDACVGRMPGAWLTREQHPLLVQYCRHILSARRIHQLILQMETDSDGEFDEDRWLRLQRAQAAQSAALMSLATKMRLTHQARRSADRAATEARDGGDLPRPWEG